MRKLTIILAALLLVPYPLHGCKTITDENITSEIRTKLANDQYASSLKINIETKSGVVTLSGTVRTQEDKDRVIRIVKNVDGVVNIHDAITVQKGEEQK